MPRTAVNKALSHAIRSRYDLSNWRRSVRKIEKETKSIRYSVAINIGSNGRVGVKSPRIERRLSTINQPASRLRSSSRAMASGWKAGMWVTGIANNHGGALVICVCVYTFQWPISKCESERKRRKTDIGFCRGRN